MWLHSVETESRQKILSEHIRPRGVQVGFQKQYANSFVFTQVLALDQSSALYQLCVFSLQKAQGMAT
jgi:hypothetical protein